MSDSGGETDVESIANDEQEVNRSESDEDSDSDDVSDYDSDDEEFSDGGKRIWRGSHEPVVREASTASPRGYVEP